MSLSDVLCRGLWSKGRSLISASGLVLGSSAESAHTAYPLHRSALSMSKIKQEINLNLSRFEKPLLFTGWFFSKFKTPNAIISTYVHVIWVLHKNPSTKTKTSNNEIRVTNLIWNILPECTCTCTYIKCIWILNKEQTYSG